MRPADRLRQILHEAIDRALDHRTPTEVIFDSAPEIVRAREQALMAMPDREVIDALAALKGRDEFTDDGDLVFTEGGDHLDHFRLRKRYYAVLERAGLRRLRFHDLRHAFGSAVITKLDAHAVQSYMGHQHYSTTQRYLHHKPRRDDAAKIAEAFEPEPGYQSGSKRDATQRNSEQEGAPEQG